ncbi:unnamed protein product [Lupinus luteus]|uniref:fructose-bisphosphate aldolase n=1 Tax=Lupinus luteus TaxID=3873 RepID=A0AAV1X9Y2_LUPLU
MAFCAENWPQQPSELAIVICQENGLVPIVHDINKCAAVTEPAAVPALVFLSGGQSKEEATLNLNAINQIKGKKPWTLSFSFGRALQQGTLKAWVGKEENLKNAQDALLTRAKSNSEATLGTYKGRAQLGVVRTTSTDQICCLLETKG